MNETDKYGPVEVIEPPKKKFESPKQITKTVPISNSMNKNKNRNNNKNLNRRDNIHRYFI